MLTTYAKGLKRHVLHNQDISMEDVVEITGRDSSLVCLCLLSVLNITLSALPINSLLLGVPLVLFSVLYLFKMSIKSLDFKLIRKKISCESWDQYIGKLIPFIYKFESFSCKRLEGLFLFENRILSGLSLFIMSFIVLLPIPFANVPGSVGVILISLAILRRDGLFLAIGYTISFAHVLGAIFGSIYLAQAL